MYHGHLQVLDVNSEEAKERAINPRECNFFATPTLCGPAAGPEWTRPGVHEILIQQANPNAVSTLCLFI
eukprot:scaffold33955_cov34-Prasinocladus_malaysianus.AAC.1